MTEHHGRVISYQSIVIQTSINVTFLAWFTKYLENHKCRLG